ATCGRFMRLGSPVDSAFTHCDRYTDWLGERDVLPLAIPGRPGHRGTASATESCRWIRSTDELGVQRPRRGHTDRHLSVARLGPGPALALGTPLGARAVDGTCGCRGRHGFAPLREVHL